jgi:hypothetical protein
VRNNAPIFNHVIPAVISLKFTLVANCRRLISFAAVGPDHNLNIGQLRGEQRNRMMTLPVFEFLRRILQHMLPPRLQKIRYYDFLSRRSNIDLDDLRAVILESLRDAEPDLELEDCRVPPLSQKGTSHHRETSWPAKVPRVKTELVPLPRRQKLHRAASGSAATFRCANRRNRHEAAHRHT